MINPFKRTDIFICKSYGHEKFENRVSAYHVLSVKKCYPQGCIFFKWNCALLNKGKTCKRGYKFVGRKCFGCKEYFDEKINNQPVLQLSASDYQIFLTELENFEDWLGSVQQKNIEIEATIVSVKPALVKTIQHKSSHLKLSGYYLHFNEAFIDRAHLEDHCYAFIFPEMQQRFSFAPDDRIEFRAQVELDYGRIIFRKLNSIQILEKSGKPAWTNSEALVARFTIIPLAEQLSKCQHCKHGLLVDVFDKSNPGGTRWRELMCLKSVVRPKDCIFHSEEKWKIVQDKCNFNLNTH